MDLSKQALDGDPRPIMTGTLVKVRRTRMSMLLILKKKIERFFRQHYESLVIVFGNHLDFCITIVKYKIY